MEKVGITEAEKALFAQMSEISNNLVPLEEGAMNAAMNGDIQSAIQYVFGEEYSTDLAEIQSLQEKFLNTIQTRLTAEINQEQSTVHVMQVIVVILVCIIVAFQIFSTLFNQTKDHPPTQGYSRGNAGFLKRKPVFHNGNGGGHF